jgi:asparagine synthase (glutamine-hydrolysing)
MWAFMIYDKKKKICFGSRDRFGKKPYFYTKMNGSFVFCSELKALTQHSSIEAEVSERSLMKYFAYGYIPAPNSLYQDIYKLPGGHSIIIDIESLNFKIKKYWEFVLEPTDTIPKNPEEEWGEEIRHLLGESVKRRLMSDVPLGIFLSGGIDSSALTYFANQALNGEKLKTFSIGFTEASFDETLWSSKVAKLFDTDHYHETLSIDKALELLPEITSKLDEPMGDSSLLPTYLLSMITRKNVTVSLGGDAGDELFAGYDPFAAVKKAELYSKLIPKPIHESIRSLAGMLSTSHSNMSLDFKIKRTLRGLSYPKKFWNNIWLGPLAPDEISALFMQEVDIEDLYSEVVDYWDLCNQTNIIDKTLFLYTKLYLQDDILVKVDRASMMNSLEVRAPFLDIELVNLVRKIPHQYKYRNGERKYILKKALEPVLPKEILYRKKKGFGIPLGQWFFEGQLRLYMEQSNSMLSTKF